MYKYVNEDYQELGFNKLYDDNRVYYYPDSKVVLYKYNDESVLINDYPFLKKYINEEHTMKHFLKKTLNDRLPIKIDKINIVEKEDAIYVATEEISDNQDIFAKGEVEFDKFIKRIISDLAISKVESLIDRLNDIDGVSIEYKIAEKHTSM